MMWMRLWWRCCYWGVDDVKRLGRRILRGLLLPYDEDDEVLRLYGLVVYCQYYFCLEEPCYHGPLFDEAVCEDTYCKGHLYLDSKVSAYCVLDDVVERHDENLQAQQAKALVCGHH